MTVNGGSNDLSDEVSLGESCYKEDSEISVKKINYKYIQQNSLKGIVKSFVLFNNLYLYCLVKKKSGQLPKHRVDLTFLDQQPTHTLFIAWKLLLSGLFILLLAILAGNGFTFFILPATEESIVPVSLLLAMIGVGLVVLGYNKSHYSVVFRSYAGRIPVLMLSHKPAQKNYRQFINLLRKSIHFAQHRNGLTVHDRLVGEMKDLRRLKDIDIVSEENYNAAQSRILSHKYYSS